MANTKSAQKEIRVADARQERNKSVRSLTKTVVHKAEGLVAKGELEAAKSEIESAESSLDRAASRGIMHPNTAARKKSRLAKKLSKAASAKKS